MAILFGTVAPPPNTSGVDNSTAPILAGKAGELINANLHGKYFTAAYRGRLFYASTLTAGTIIPAIASSLVSTFTLWNPLGSGTVVELIGYEAAMEGATTVVSDVSLWYQTSVGQTNTALSSLTALTVRTTNIGGPGVSAISAYSAATFAAALTKGPVLFGPGAVTSASMTQVNVEFDGRIILQPGVAITTAGNAAQTSAANQSMYWAEWPL